MTLPKRFSQRRQWHPTPVLLPGKSHGWRSLVGCSPWGREESDTTERLHFHFSPSCIGEGNGNPLQCSCLENPGDGGAWWAAVSGSHRVRHDWSDLAAAVAAARGLIPMTPYTNDTYTFSKGLMPMTSPPTWMFEWCSCPMSSPTFGSIILMNVWWYIWRF